MIEINLFVFYNKTVHMLNPSVLFSVNIFAQNLKWYVPYSPGNVHPKQFYKMKPFQKIQLICYVELNWVDQPQTK